MTNEQFEMLKQPFSPNEVQWRLMLTTQNSTGLAVPYLDSRAIQRRLDAVIGHDNWQNTYQVVTSGKNDDPTAHICTISVYNEQRGEWISKSNGAGNTDIEPIKGGLSDAFKRAASSWGIGRYLYDFDGVWVNVEMQGKSKIIAKADRPKLDKSYNDTVRKLFPNMGAAGIKMPAVQQKQTQIQPIISQNPQNRPPTTQHQQQNQQPANTYNQPVQSQYSPQQQHSPQPQYNIPCYVIKEAVLKKDFTQIPLDDGNGNAITAFYKGEAKVGKNQRITNVKLSPKKSPSGDYYVMDDYQLAA